MIKIMRRHMSVVRKIPSINGGQINTCVETFGTDRTLIWVPGFLGTMNGIKSQELSKWNKDIFRQKLWKFDYSGIGESVGELKFSNWVTDAESVIKAAFEENHQKVDIIASSMGAFIALHLAESNPDFVKTMFLCAPAKDFHKMRFHAVMSSPGDNLPIPEDYLHSSGLTYIPKDPIITHLRLIHLI